MNMPEWWMDSTGVRMEIISPHGPLYIESLAVAMLRARALGPEVVRFTWDWTDPETGEVTSGAAVLLLQEVPDPRSPRTEEQPAAPADATATETVVEAARKYTGEPYLYRGPGEEPPDPFFRQSGPGIQ